MLEQVSEEIINENTENKGEMPYLYSTRIQNIQTLKDITFKWSPGINVFVGDNNDGKTTIMNKTLSLIIGFEHMTPKKRKQYIRRRTQTAVITHVMSNGDTFRFGISKDNIAGTFRTMDGEIEINDTKEVIELFKESLGLVTFVNDPTNILNIIDKHKASFLVNANPKENAESLSVLYYDEDCEKMLSYTEERLKQVNIDLRETSRKRGIKLYEKNNINYIEPDILNEKKTTLNELDKRINSLDCLESLSYLDRELVKNIDDEKLSQLNTAINSLSKISSFITLLEREIVPVKDYSELEKTIKLLDNSYDPINMLFKDLIDNKEEVIYNENMKVYEKAVERSNMLLQAEKEISSLNRDLLIVKDTSHLENVLSNIEKSIPSIKLLNNDLLEIKDTEPIEEIYNNIVTVNRIGYSLIDTLKKDIDVNSLENIINSLSIANSTGVFNLPDLIENKEEEKYKEIKKEYDSLEFECPLCGQIKCNHSEEVENGKHN